MTDGWITGRGRSPYLVFLLCVLQLFIPLSMALFREAVIFTYLAAFDEEIRANIV